ncbi:hypothetical protein D3C81_1951130 [compost metagenome]
MMLSMAMSPLSSASWPWPSSLRLSRVMLFWNLFCSSACLASAASRAVCWVRLVLKALPGSSRPMPARIMSSWPWMVCEYSSPVSLFFIFRVRPVVLPSLSLTRS